MLQYIKNVLSGRIAHWTQTNNVVINEIWERITNLSAPTKMIFGNYLAAASFVGEILLLNNQGRKVGLNIDVKKINVQQFRDFYCILLSFFIFTFLTMPSRQSSRDELHQSLLDVTSDWELTESILNSLAKANARAGADIIDMNSLVIATWEEIVKTIGFGDGRSPSQMAYVGITLAHSYKEAQTSIINAEP